MEKNRATKQIHFLEKKRLEKLISQLLENADKEKPETIQLQIALKGFDPRRDNKMTKDVAMPYKCRAKDKICILADANTAEKAEALGLPYHEINKLVGDEKASERNVLFKRYKHFILSPGFNKALPLKTILRKRKSHYALQANDKLDEVYEQALKTYKCRIKDLFCAALPVGHSGLPVEHVYENIEAAMVYIISFLKKGEQNIKNVFIKTNASNPVTIY